MERNRKLNVDNIGTVVTDYTSINRREAPPDVLPEESDAAAPAALAAGMGKVALKEAAPEWAAAADSKPAATAGSSGDSSGKAGGGEAKKGGEGKPAAAARAGAGGAGGKGEAGPPSEMDAVEHYNNFALTHEVGVGWLGWIGGRRMFVSIMPYAHTHMSSRRRIAHIHPHPL